jgi:hypothetical protein
MAEAGWGEEQREENEAGKGSAMLKTRIISAY